jgi:hypothetical protein
VIKKAPKFIRVKSTGNSWKNDLMFRKSPKNPMTSVGEPKNKPRQARVRETKI